MTPGMPDPPCHPIGCDAGIHLPGCPKDVTEFYLGGLAAQFDHFNQQVERQNAEMLDELTFADPEPYRGSKTWTPEGGVAYTYSQLMQPVDPARFPDHWSWSQL